MDKCTKDALINLLLGAGLIGLAVKSEAVAGSKAEVKDRPDTKDKPRTTRSPASNQSYQEYLARIRGTSASNQQQNEPNPQRYDVFLDIVERYTDPRQAGPGQMMIMMPAPGSEFATGVTGTHAGSVLPPHMHICQMNENDGKWTSMIFAGSEALLERFTAVDITELIISGGHTVNSFALVLIAIPVGADSLADQLAGAKWKIFGEYATYGDASRNLSAIASRISEACVDPNAPYNRIIND